MQPHPLTHAALPLTHGVHAPKDLLHPHDLVVQLVISDWVGQEGVSVGDEEVEDGGNLQTRMHRQCVHTPDVHIQVTSQLTILLVVLSP